MHAHIFTVNELAFERGELPALRLDAFKDLFKAAHKKLALRVDFAQRRHHRKNILLERHLVMTIGQQNVSGERGFFQHGKIVIKTLTQPRLVLR